LVLLASLALEELQVPRGVALPAKGIYPMEGLSLRAPARFHKEALSVSKALRVILWEALRVVLREASRATLREEFRVILPEALPAAQA
jgi:hypothetical protein